MGGLSNYQASDSTEPTRLCYARCLPLTRPPLSLGEWARKPIADRFALCAGCGMIGRTALSEISRTRFAALRSEYLKNRSADYGCVV